MIACLPPKQIVKKSAGNQVKSVLKSLERLGNRRIREEMGPRYGIHTNKAFGVPMSKTRQLAKNLGQDHELAANLWKTGWYEARIVGSFIDEPERVANELVPPADPLGVFEVCV